LQSGTKVALNTITTINS